MEKIRQSSPSESLTKSINNALPILTLGMNDMFTHIKYNVPMIEFIQLKDGDLMFRWSLECVTLHNGYGELLEVGQWFSTKHFGDGEINSFKDETGYMPIIYDLHSELDLMYHDQIKLFTD